VSECVRLREGKMTSRLVNEREKIVCACVYEREREREREEEYVSERARE
jgi:hypothetical protein